MIPSSHFSPSGSSPVYRCFVNTYDSIVLNDKILKTADINYWCLSDMPFCETLKLLESDAFDFFWRPRVSRYVTTMKDTKKSVCAVIVNVEIKAIAIKFRRLYFPKRCMLIAAYQQELSTFSGMSGISTQSGRMRMFLMSYLKECKSQWWLDITIRYFNHLCQLYFFNFVIRTFYKPSITWIKSTVYRFSFL